MSKKNSVYYFTLIFLLIFLFIFFIPKLSIKIFNFKKEKKFKEFNNYLVTTKNFNPQIFWQFREFFCPGYFEANKNGLKNVNLRTFEYLKNIQKINLIFAKYNCPYLKSYENLTKENSLLFFLNENKIKNNYQLIRKTNEFIYFKNKNQNTYYFIFLVDNEKMKKAVGFFDYKEKDKKTTENMKWLNITIINL